MSEEKVNSSPPENEEQFRLLVNSISDYAMFILDPSGRILTWNPGAQRIKGYAPNEIIGQHFSCFYPEEDRAAKPFRLLCEAEIHGMVHDEGWRLRKGGERFWAAVTLTAMRDPERKLVGFAKVTRDMSERKKSEEKLRASEEQFRRLVESVDEYAIYMLDPQGNVATWNSGAQNIKQYKASEIIGKNFACFYTAQDVAARKPEQNLQDTRRKGHVRDQGLRVRKDGTTFHADVFLSVLRDEAGVLRGYSKVTRDVTDQLRHREMEAAKIAAEKANQAKDDFLATLSHELRTPLTPALAAASLLSHNSGRIPAEFKPELDTIRRNVQLEARLIDDLLDLTRVTRGKMELRFERVDSHEVVREAFAIAQPDSEQKQLRVTLELEAKEHEIWADRIRIQQVFWNLINNAVKFTPPNESIRIRTSNDEAGHLILEVIDTGIGIDAAYQGALFEPFDQGDRAVSRQFGGLGLGLAISRQLVSLHAGGLEVESAGRSQGATFRVTLDLADKNARVEKAAATGPQAEFKSLRILLVEDHGDTRRTLSRLLTYFGHQISVADCTQSALDIVDSEKFDVVLSDIGLPDGTGYEVISQAKRKQTLTGVALTGFGTDADVKRGKEAGFDFHLTKPVDFHELRTVLDQVGK
jgi:PAS domain S-box-containing protein